ncbi:MAG: arsenate reductase [Pseudomonadota bacterium]|jgi:arsenate reductase|nr:MAG: arsenate reductase [Pseudomonadota bacterium]
MSLVIYHNPRCSKSRATLALLEEHGQSPKIIEYLKEPLDSNILLDLAVKLGVSVTDMIRKTEAPYKDLDLAGADEDTLISAICAHPILLQRPIVVRDTRAVIGRPPEGVLSIL